MKKTLIALTAAAALLATSVGASAASAGPKAKAQVQSVVQILDID